MKRRRRKFSSELKLKIILEVLRERQTLTELSQKYEVHPNQISKWKSEFLKDAGAYMNFKRSKRSKEDELDVEQLYSTIGKLKMENDYLKKKLC